MTPDPYSLEAIAALTPEEVYALYGLVADRLEEVRARSITCVAVSHEWSAANPSCTCPPMSM